MLENRNILCISNPSWEGDYAKTIVELMSVFAHTNKVLYIDNPSTLKDVLQGFLTRKKMPYGRLLGFSKRVVRLPLEQGGGVYVMTPPVVLPINYLPPGKLYSLLLRFNGWLLTRAIRKALRRLDMNDRLINIVAFNPALGVVCGRKFNEELLVYHCYDQISAANWLKKHGARHEREFMQMSDAVVVTSQGLLEEKGEWHSDCYLVKNAVNFPLFSTAFRAEVRTEPPVVGYIGSIDDRLDYPLLERLISGMPSVRFVFIGRVVDEGGAAVLRRYPNVVFHGPQKVQQLPGWLEGFSAGIIPFVKNSFTKGIYPLKINEYLAAGLPVVSTDFGHLQDFAGIVSIAGSDEAFQSMLEEEIRDDSPAKRLVRKDVASRNSWEQRAEELSAIIKKMETRGVAKTGQYL